jgi:S-adenosylmethionine-diacylglycerol 3-amino-3-carboxypropyl transferase
VNLDRLHDRLFDALYARALVYNTCWEDPAVDRQALALGPDDRMLVIASAGCNALDYALDGPAAIHAVDLNPRQIALLELKLAGIRTLAFEDFFALFGHGRHARFPALYRQALRPALSPYSQTYWDRHGDVFAPARSGVGGLYFHGLSGKVARAFHLYLACRPGLARAIDDLLSAGTLADQRLIFDRRIQPALWSEGMNWVLSRQLTMSMLGVPQPQRREVESQHPGGVAGFIREAIEYVFRELPLALNYFWRVYLCGTYSPACCPRYLEPDNFARLQGGLAECVQPRVASVTGFLRAHPGRISKFVLLDHMDWMSSARPQALAEEWAAIFARAAQRARIIFRSAHRWPRYLDAVQVPGADGRPEPLTARLHFHPEWSALLARDDRVHTYAGFHIADMPA